MKNLTVHNQSQRNLQNLIIQSAENSKDYLSCVNSDNDHLYLYHKNYFYDIPPDVKSDVEGLIINEYTEFDKPVALEYCSILENVIFALESGTLLTIDVNNHDVNSCNYFFDGGISCIKFSPDHEIFVVVTKLNFVHVLFTQTHLTRTEESNILTAFLGSDEFGEKQFITVGWGKKSTQFHGSEGKAAAKAVKTSVQCGSTDDGSTNISWRGDGTLFVISYIDANDSLRKFKVFNREAILQYTSEPTEGLDENLAWKPSGNLVATSQELPNKRVVALFEKNGLKHRDFTFAPKTANIKIKNISWSSDSDVLSISYVDKETEQTHIQLWTEKNYHWYLKQNIKFAKDNQVLSMFWSTVPRSGKKLIILTANELRTYSYRWSIDHSKGKQQTDKSVVGVIDGENMLLTSFRDNVVPPPMAQFTLNIGEQVNAIVFAPPNSNVYTSNSFFCVLDKLRLAFFNHVNKQYIPHKILPIQWKNNIEENYFLHTLHHFLWINDDSILCSLSTNNCLLLVLKVTEESIYVEKEIQVTGFIEHIVQSATNKNEFYIFKNDYKVFKFTLNENERGMYCFYVTESMEQVDVLSIENKDILVSRTNKHRLYINDKNVASNITSFYVHSEFLLLTTLQHTLLCFSLNEEGLKQLMTSDLTVKPWENGNNVIISYLNIRRIERGSTLITSVSKDARTILQMPRGNLECIQPRTLSLFTIAHYINQLKYYEAFDLMRKQRINLNLIYDHSPSLFMKNVDKFINDISKKNPSWLSLFLSDLKDEDITLTTYASNYLDRIGKSLNEKPEEKVKIVCDTMRGKMEACEFAEKLVQPILISLVRGNKVSGVEDALQRIKQIQEKSGSVSEALKFLVYLVDVNELFDAALGMYDLDLTMLVAQNSQKDPKEYVPFLNNFKNMQSDCMKYEIDKHLKRYEFALGHLTKLPDKFDECIKFIETHDLFRAGLRLFSSDSLQYKNIANCYGKKLLSSAKYEEAGIMFGKGASFENSVNAYRLAGCWQECIVMAHRANLSSSDLNMLYKTLISRLKGDKKYKEAATIACKYMNNPEEAIILMCEGKFWMDAWREATLMQREDILESHIKAGVLEYAQHLLIQIQTNRQDFEKHKARLEVVKSEEYRKAKQEQYALPYECDITTEDGINDMMSDTASNIGSTTSFSSQVSRSSGRSYRSSKNRRKQQRKLLNLKEGSLFEDLALLRTLHQLIAATHSQKAEVYEIIKMLLQFSEDKLSEQLYKELDELLYLFEVSESKIWNLDNETDTNSSTRGQFLCGIIPQGLVETYILYPPKKDSNSWSISILKASKKV